MIRNLLKSAALKKNFTSCTRMISINSSNMSKFKVKTNFKKETIELFDEDKSNAVNFVKSLEFPFVWLRDNCQVNN